MRPSSKVPASDNSFCNAVTTREGIDLPWGNRRWLNIGIPTGEKSRVFVLDVDGATGAAASAAMELAHGTLALALESIVPNGRHLLFAGWQARFYRGGSSRIAGVRNGS